MATPATIKKLEEKSLLAQQRKQMQQKDGSNGNVWAQLLSLSEQSDAPSSHLLVRTEPVEGAPPRHIDLRPLSGNYSNYRERRGEAFSTDVSAERPYGLSNYTNFDANSGPTQYAWPPQNYQPAFGPPPPLLTQQQNILQPLSRPSTFNTYRRPCTAANFAEKLKKQGYLLPPKCAERSSNHSTAQSVQTATTTKDEVKKGRPIGGHKGRRNRRKAIESLHRKNSRQRRRQKNVGKRCDISEYRNYRNIMRMPIETMAYKRGKHRTLANWQLLFVVSLFVLSVSIPLLSFPNSFVQSLLFSPIFVRYFRMDKRRQIDKKGIRERFGAKVTTLAVDLPFRIMFSQWIGRNGRRTDNSFLALNGPTMPRQA
ncbi:hypothetical protein niasHT_004294 [Heterodera trifolii]|uniref:Uncharacterized protein n=1 Tax=Heterodera trifolii TaxID=157864 RepID=A0ABD2LNF9_9BILA